MPKNVEKSTSYTRGRDEVDVITISHHSHGIPLRQTDKDHLTLWLVTNQLLEHLFVAFKELALIMPPITSRGHRWLPLGF